MYDIIIIGAGVSGCAIARELSRYKAKICVMDKEEDVCCGTSKANSAIIHAGYDAKYGSLMAKLNVKGNLMMDKIAEDLDVPFIRNGSLVVSKSENEMPKLKALYENGIKNEVPDLQILSKYEALKLEPNLSDEIYAVLYAPTGGIICPFTLNIALAENANQNGVEFRLNTEVSNIKKLNNGGYEITTNQGAYMSKYVVNAAGVYADVFHNMVSDQKIKITARRGDYCLLDKNAGSHVSHTIFSLPNKYGKGVLVTPTIHGNLLLGPTAIDTDDKEATNTTQDGISELIEKSGLNVKSIPLRQVITSFAGLRAHEACHEFIIGEPTDAKGFIDCAGIESPGLTGSVAIGAMVADIMKDKMNLKNKTDFIETRKGILNPNTLSFEDRNKLIRENPAYGNIICRCEMISEGEIIDAIHRPLGAKSIDGIKRRTRAGMGRCQSGFCLPKTMKILSRELKASMSNITKSGGKSNIIIGTNKDRL